MNWNKLKQGSYQSKSKPLRWVCYHKRFSFPFLIRLEAQRKKAEEELAASEATLKTAEEACAKAQAEAEAAEANFQQ